MTTKSTPQTLEQALGLIKAFASQELISALTGTTATGTTAGASKLSQLETEGSTVFPAELRAYLTSVAPSKALYFTMVGNPIELWPLERMSWHLPGYNFNPVENQPIDDWDENWFLIADEGADPIMVDLSEQGHVSPVYRAMHGAGCWDFEPIADSIGQFLLCAAAMHHALDEMDIEEPVQDDDLGFNLCEDAAKWLFPFIRRHATEYQDEWLSVFDNA
ncbi:SMI1/KNR4 family protein [Oceanospirillum sp. HFRX-1_2]